MNITELRQRLLSRRGQWTWIASEANVHPKTLERIMRVDDYMPTLRNFQSICRALDAIPAREKDPA
jgi:hypothetical protein